MLRRFIRSIRRKPKMVRDNVALGLAVSVTATVFVVWLYHFPARNAALVERQRGDDDGAFGLFDAVGDQVGSLGDALDGVSEKKPEQTDLNTNQSTKSQTAQPTLQPGTTERVPIDINSYEQVPAGATDSTKNSLDKLLIPAETAEPRVAKIVTTSSTKPTIDNPDQP